MNKVHLIDNMEFMATISDNYYELAIVDPPYGIGSGVQKQSVSKRKGRQNGFVSSGTLQSKNWDSHIPKPEYFKELFRISKNQIIWGGNYFPLPLTNSWIIWNKLQSLETRSDGEMAWSSFKKTLKIVPLLQDGFKRGQNVGYNQPIIYNKPYSGKQTIHPTQKPIALYKWLLQKYAQKGDKIFDSHVGSGSSRIACYDLGYDFTGCEIDKDYWEAQEKRYNVHVSQMSLFSPEDLEPKQVYEQGEIFL